jgi:hypothetical protein
MWSPALNGRKYTYTTNPHVLETAWVHGCDAILGVECMVLWVSCCKMSDDDRDIDIESDVSL